MALRVPTPELQGPARLGGIRTVAAETPFQSLRMPDTSFNARMMQQLGDSGVKLAGYLQEQEDERLLLEFQSGLGDWERETLYGEGPDGAPSTKKSGAVGVLSREEKAAFGVTDEVEQALTQKLSEMNGSLSGLSRSGQMAARELAQRRREALLNQVARYEFQQRDAYNRKLRAQAEAAAKRAAETAWATPEAMAAGLSRVTSAATTRASHEYAALPEQERKERIDADVAAAVDEFYRTAIMRAVGQGQIKIGRELYEQAVADGKVTLEDDDLLTRTVQYGEQIDVVINGATALYAQHPEDMAAAVSAARSMGLDGDTERRLVSELEGRYRSNATSEAAAEYQKIEDMRQAALEGALYTQYSGADFATVDQATLDRLSYINRGGALVDDPDVYNLLDEMTTLGSAAAELDLTQYMDRLSASSYAMFRERQAQARAAAAGDAQAALDAADLTDAKGQVAQAIAAFELEPAQERAFRRLMNAYELEYVRKNMRNPTSEERNQFIDSVLSREVEINEDGFIFSADTETVFNQMLEAQDLQIPQLDLLQIINALAALGKPATLDNIERMYDAKRKGVGE